MDTSSSRSRAGGPRPVPRRPRALTIAGTTRHLWVGLLSLPMAMAACTGLRSTPLASVPPAIAAAHPVVIIPGILGSKLEDSRNGRVVWGKIFDLRALTVHQSLVQPSAGGFDGLELPFESTDFRVDTDHLVPTGIMDNFTIIPHVAEVKVYRRLLQALAVCGYRPGSIKSCGLHTNAAVLAYDWRRDIVESAQKLAARIRQIQANTGDPRTKVDIVAHSMGGLVAEYYLLYGDEDVLDRDPLPPPSYAGAASVRRLILLGTPNEGSLEALRYLHEGYRVGFRRVSNLATFTMPAIYELLPAGAAVRMVDPDGRRTDVDLFDAGTWQRYGLGPFSQPSRRGFLHECQRLFPRDWQARSTEISGQLVRFLGAALKRARRLHAALAPFATDPPPTEVYLFGSASRATLDAAELRAAPPGWRLAFGSTSWGQGHRALPAAPGDGTVTAASFTWGTFTLTAPHGAPTSGVAAGFPVDWVDDEHARLPADTAVLARIVAILARPSGPPPTVHH
jgi:pimeloyl-ACP methyl ester carboxylesterase